jgi:hypothetical protein
MRVLRRTALLSILAAGEFVLMTAMEFLVFRRMSGGLPSLDTRIAGFTVADVTQWLAALGPQGAETVIVWHYMTFDLLFPLLLSMALASVILWLGNRLPRFAAYSETSRQTFALAIVAPYAIADYAQNLAVMELLQEPFEVDPGEAGVASALVVAKFVFFLLPVLVIALFALAGQRRA